MMNPYEAPQNNLCSPNKPGFNDPDNDLPRLLFWVGLIILSGLLLGIL